MLVHEVKKFARTHPLRAVMIGYLCYAFLAWLILLLPLCHKVYSTPLDDFFTAISAMTTTGLMTVDFGQTYTGFGQFIILLLIQAGGIGYMTFGTFIIMSTAKRLSSVREKIVSVSFRVPKEFQISEFIYQTIVFTFICEFIGAIVLSVIFKNSGIEHYILYGIFHSISAFCTAGIELIENSFENYRYNVGLNLILSTLSILGTVGFIAWLDFYKKLKGEKKQLTFTTKIILSATFGFLFFGTIIFFLIEFYSSPESKYHSWLASFFQVMSASTTAGFNTLDIGSLKQSSLILMVFFMMFGASPAGTGGGLKSTTFAALVGMVKSTLRGESTVSIWKRAISIKRLQLAASTFSFFIFILITSVFFLVIIEDKEILSLFFEAVSALCTTGLSMGITPALSAFGKVLIMILMFTGRIGILTFGIAITAKHQKKVIYKRDNELVF